MANYNNNYVQNNVPKAPQQTTAQYIERPQVAKFLNETLGTKKSQFVADLLALQEATPTLKDCEQGELIRCAMTATALNLPLNKNLGYSYVVPYKNKKADKTEPQFMIGWKGFVQLAMRSGQYKTINVCEVRDGEMKRNKFTGEVNFVDEFPNNKVIGYLAYFKLLNGMEQSSYMSVDEVLNHADRYSQAFNKEIYLKLQNGEQVKDAWKYSSPWYKQFDDMAMKTVLKRLLSKYGILSLEMQNAMVEDQKVDGEYKDNPSNISAEFVEKTPEVLPTFDEEAPQGEIYENEEAVNHENTTATTQPKAIF